MWGVQSSNQLASKEVANNKQIRRKGKRGKFATKNECAEDGRERTTCIIANTNSRYSPKHNKTQRNDDARRPRLLGILMALRSKKQCL